MRSLNVLLICALAFAGCATNPKPAATTAPTAPKVATPRNDCPPGYAFVSNSAGTACWPTDKQTPPAGCKPFRCPDSGYMLWSCPVLALSTGTTDTVEDKQELIEHCYHLAREFRRQPTFSAYETVISCLCRLRVLLAESEREMIDTALRESNARAEKVGYTPKQCQ